MNVPDSSPVEDGGVLFDSDSPEPDSISMEGNLPEPAAWQTALVKWSTAFAVWLGY